MGCLSVLVVILLGVVIVSACSSASPTAAHFCRMPHCQESRYLKVYGHPSSNPLEALVQSVSTVGQWVAIFEALQKHAPSTIEPQVTNILNLLKNNRDEASNSGSDSLQALLAGSLTSLEAPGSWQQVSNYAATHCITDSAC
jgi:hypothetical protein